MIGFFDVPRRQNVTFDFDTKTYKIECTTCGAVVFHGGLRRRAKMLDIMWGHEIQHRPKPKPLFTLRCNQCSTDVHEIFAFSDAISALAVAVNGHVCAAAQ